MFRGILALFTSGLIVNPMVICGMVTGIALYSLLDSREIFQVYKNPLFYGIALCLAGVYVIGFRRVYKTTGETDRTETFLSIIGAFFRFVLTSLLMISFISLFDMGGDF